MAILGKAVALEQHTSIIMDMETSAEADFHKLLRLPGPFLRCWSERANCYKVTPKSQWFRDKISNEFILCSYSSLIRIYSFNSKAGLKYKALLQVSQ